VAIPQARIASRNELRSPISKWLCLQYSPVWRRACITLWSMHNYSDHPCHWSFFCWLSDQKCSAIGGLSNIQNITYTQQLMLKKSKFNYVDLIFCLAVFNFPTGKVLAWGENPISGFWWIYTFWGPLTSWVPKSGFYKMSVSRLSGPIKTIVLVKFKSNFVIKLLFHCEKKSRVLWFRAG